MRTNGSGAAGNRERDFKAFDGLPADARAMLADAAFNAGAESIARHCRGRNLYREEYAIEIKGWLSDMTRSMTRETYGPDHPQSGAKWWEPLVRKRSNTRVINMSAQRAAKSTKPQPDEPT